MSGTLSNQDLRLLLDLVGGCYSVLDAAKFRTSVLSLVREAIPCDLAAYNEVEPGGTRGVALFDPPERMIFDDPGGVLARVAPSSPIIARFAKTRDGRAYKLSDFLRQDELRSTSLWKEALGPLGVDYQIAFTLPSQPTVLVGVTLNHGAHDFSERDRQLLNLARPHLAQAYRNAQIHTEARRRLLALERGLESSDRAAIILQEDGRIRTASRQAQDLLRRGFGSLAAKGAQIPPDLLRWVERRRSEGPEQDHVPLVVARAETRLLVRFVRRAGGAGADLLLLELSPDPLSVPALRALGLTVREGEVLRLIAMGETAEGVAAELGIRPSTVRKHLENLYRKLGVRSQAAAVAAAWAGAESTTMLDHGEQSLHDPVAQKARQRT